MKPNKNFNHGFRLGEPSSSERLRGWARIWGLVLLTCVLCPLISSHSAFGQNVRVVNPDSSPVPVKLISSVAAGTPAPVNVSKINGVTPLMGAGNTGTGSQRVTIATDQAAVPVSLATVPSHAVTNAGTFAVQNTAGAVANASTTAAAITQGTKAVAAAGTPELLVGSTTKVESVEIFARKNPTTANTGAVYIGVSASGGSNHRVLAPGESFSISAPAGKKIDLNTIYVDAATTADAVTYTAVN